MIKRRSMSFQLTFYFFIFFILISLTDIILKNVFIYPKIKIAQQKFIENGIFILRSSVNDSLDLLSSLNKDYAYWTTLYNHVDTQFENSNFFINENFNYETFENLEIDIISIYSKNKKLLWNGKKIGKKITTNSEYLKNIKEYILYYRNPNYLNTVLGIFTLNKENYFFASTQITDSDKIKPSNGYIIFAKKIDKNYINKLSIKNNSNIEYITPTNSNLKFINNITTKINDSKTLYKYYLDDINNIYLNFNNINGELAFILKISFLNGLNPEHINSTFEKILSIIFALIFMLILYLISKNKTIKPIIQLNSHIKKLISTNNYTPLEIKADSEEAKNLISSFNILIHKINTQNEEIKNMNIYLTELAYIDPLTKLYNRRMFEEKFQEFWILAKKNNHNISLIFCDIDYYKNFNDYYGHLAGDETLIKIADTLLDSFPNNNEYIFRYGGEEFVILINNIDLDHTIKKVKLLQKNISKLNIKHKKSLVSDRITLSFGIINTPYNNNINFLTLINMADTALYKSKKTGRNTFTVFNQPH
ncbi:diguanylate cyclase (GGDEF)-like protein [Hypnocyclicus thermotrophus]|uniref:Diguanylate cyclase (GGDEF)-like protein n=1 Tax=Hypnocyclicus thermotrophus TaxID=1627895 RepID=A0AA46DZX9_9FUSO|nr:diguanylate cyclase [Hypnocyclicus thermotrophus]TDT72259.1 diguanylate cyclase (GGDEF)-like protein [Hypnocyclicus thermotrophus]